MVGVGVRGVDVGSTGVRVGGMGVGVGVGGAGVGFCAGIGVAVGCGRAGRVAGTEEGRGACLLCAGCDASTENVTFSLINVAFWVSVINTQVL